MITSKVRVKIEQIVRLKLSGLTVGQICEQSGMPESTVKRLSKRAEFHEREQEVLAELTAASGPAVAQTLDLIQERVRQERPATLEKLLALRGSSNQRVSLEACKDLLDRDPDRALQKTSRTTFQPAKPVEALSEAQQRKLWALSGELSDKLNRRPM